LYLTEAHDNLPQEIFLRKLLSPLLSKSMKNSLAQQRKSCPAIAHALDQFELVAFSLGRTIVLG
jgi:hypothetical protein